MAQIPATTKAKILVALADGDKPNDIAKLYGVSRSQVYNFQNFAKNTKADENIVKASRDTQLLMEVVDKMEATAPDGVYSGTGELQEFITTAKSLEKLEMKFHASFESILTSADKLLSCPEISIVDWQIITNTLASAFKDIYNVKGTTINVAQGGEGNNSLTMFQSRMKA